MKLSKTLGLVVVCAVLAVPLTASAQDHLDVSPLEVDFGDVVVGETSSAIVTLTNVDGAAVSVSQIVLVGCSADFVVSPAVPPEPPISIPMPPDPGNSFDVTVSFTPSTLGLQGCELFIRSNALVGGAVYVSLLGAGVTEEPADVIMDEIIELFEMSVDAGSIAGLGPGNSAPNRLRAFGNMLDAADDLIEAGDYEGACDQLWTAYRKADGEARPPDFVQGDAVPELALMILDMMDLLGCP